jgi:CDP-diacylglycerol pyrophosphatase
MLPGALLAIGAFLAATLATTTLADPFGRDALRSVVAACAVSKSTLGLAFPCTDVELGSPGRDGYAVIRSPGFASEFLLSPLAAYDGIESPGLRSDAATGLWQAAWSMRADVIEALGRPVPRTDLALAVNASGPRTQDHFHIHLDCLRASVGKTLDTRRASITEAWTRLRVPLRGQTYWARAIPGPDLSGVNVPRLIAEAPPAASQPMDHLTLAVVGATLADGSDGFYLLANWQNIAAERLLDHRCRQG